MTSPDPTPTPDSQLQTASSTTSKLLFLLVLPLIGIVMAVLVLLNNPVQSNANLTDLPGQSVDNSVPTFNPPGIMNKPAPDFTLTTLDGQSVNLKDYAGRVVFVNFWGTWCVPCVKELPALQAFASQQGDQGAVVLAINSSETPDQITAFFEEHDMTLSSIPVLLDPDYTVSHLYGIYNMPTTYVITPDGMLKNVKYGGMTSDDLQAYMDEALGVGESIPAGRVSG